MKKSIVLLIALMLLLCSCEPVQVKQSYQIHEVDKNCEITYLVSTQVWIRDWSGDPKGLPYWETITCTQENLDSTLVRELKKANQCASRIKHCFK